MSNMSTLANIKGWFNEIIDKNLESKPLFFVVGTKKDTLIESVFKFVESEGIKIANEIGAEYWSVSSLTGFMVEEFFTRMAVLAFEKLIQSEIEFLQIKDSPSYASKKFIKLKNEKRCKKLWNVLCARL